MPRSRDVETSGAVYRTCDLKVDNGMTFSATEAASLRSRVLVSEEIAVIGSRCVSCFIAGRTKSHGIRGRKTPDQQRLPAVARTRCRDSSKSKPVLALEGSLAIRFETVHCSFPTCSRRSPPALDHSVSDANGSVSLPEKECALFISAIFLHSFRASVEQKERDKLTACVFSS